MGKSNSKGLFSICGQKSINRESKSFQNKKSKIESYPNIKESTQVEVNKNSNKTCFDGKSISTIEISTKNNNQKFREIEKEDGELVITLSKLNPRSKFYPSNKNLPRGDTLTDPDRLISNLEVKLSLSSFDTIKVIGKGTFGKVILVKNLDDNKFYALKCLKKLNILRSNNLKNLKNEKLILEKIDHPYIIKLHRTFQDSHKIYMLFDYYNGGELFYHLQKFKRFSEDMVKFYAAEIYLAIKFLHKNNIIYRDIKPENIVLDQSGHIKLIDFGLAKDGINMYSKCITLCGTNEYLPPEIIKGEPYSFNFDWWGFGIIIYEMLFGRPPFLDRDGNKNKLFRKICKEDPDFKTGKISNEAKNLISSLLNKDPTKRIIPENIPSHPFFKEIKFDLMMIRKVPPPFKPKTNCLEDFSNIDPCFLKQAINSPVKNLKYNIDQKIFSEF